jgi:hypothetical protein
VARAWARDRFSAVSAISWTATTDRLIALEQPHEQAQPFARVPGRVIRGRDTRAAHLK